MTLSEASALGRIPTMQFRDLRTQYLSLKPEIDKAISDVLESGQFIKGKQVKCLEEELADFVGVNYCVTCANGTDALQLALMAWGVGVGDAVFVPDFTFFSSGEVVSAVGATPVFVDVDSRSFNLDSDQLERCICWVMEETELAPRAVIAVDLFGLPADYARLREICSKYDLLLLEDGAQGFGGEIDGRKACAFGDISTTSFFPAKPLGCYGDGGAVFTDDGGWAKAIESLSVHGKGESKYDNVRIGMNSRLDAIQASILRPKLKAFAEREIENVERVSEWYSEALADTPLVLPECPKHCVSSWAQYTIQLPEYIERDSFQARLNQAGIPTMVYYPKPMHAQMAFSGHYVQPFECVETKRLCRSVLSLPMGPYMTREDVDYVSSHISSILG